MMNQFSTYSTQPICGVGNQHQQRPLTTPRHDRRVIFPSLHGFLSPTRSPGPTSYPQPISGHQPQILSKNIYGIEQRGQTKESSPSPTNVDANIQIPQPHPPLMRANSLDGILIPLPKLSLEEGNKSTETFPTLPQRPRSQDTTITRKSIPSAPAATKWVAPPTRLRSNSLGAIESTSSKSMFGEVRPRTYYPAATIPTPVSDKKTPSKVKPTSSILRRKGCRQSLQSVGEGEEGVSSRASSTCSLDGGGSSVSSLVGPTLASPLRIQSLHPKRIDGEKEGHDIGESENDIERLSDTPKVLPHEEGKVRRISSAKVVRKNEEEQKQTTQRRGSNASVGNCVSRHASLECLANRKISFDPHITVFEFGITPFEGRGGQKWWTEDELTRFKQEAIQRIRMRSVKVIPTGTGACVAVPTKYVNERARAPSRPTTNGRKSQGSISFNHPALGCDDEHDPEFQQIRINDAVSEEIKNILVVDPHDIFLALFTKSLKHMVPHASVATARSAEEAMTRIEAARKCFPLRDGGAAHGFDIIIIEERLRGSVDQLASPQASQTQQNSSSQAAGDDSIQRRWKMESGSALIRYLVESEHEIKKTVGDETSLRRSLLVGCSTRMSLEKEKLEKSGADCIWGKPPPEMKTALRNELLKLLLKKRNRLDNKLFD